MQLDLFPHNQTAYEAALRLLDTAHKAAIIHPTGTGKSFIGFRLCFDHPEARILWLSPSEYIFKTQLENVKAACNYTPENITFLTYAKLMLRTKEELRKLQPDFIILDEFHRCGARMWGEGVRQLLILYPMAPLLGLSATNIRYLDSQRDMAKELFDGHIASEITLGESMVRGILKPPRYVLSVYSYQKEWKKYEERIRNTKSKAVRDAATKYLEALRRALEKADGLEEIFRKHMKEKTGKYIVFCAGKEHMDEMMEHLEWFRGVDPKPHVYSLYTAEPETEQSFNEFKTDHDDTHLRLLYCIDALNEGIHVDDISGVILLRPTVSPTIYKQQIGRALAAGKKNETVIFDIVMNIENLYSVGAIEEEMEVATAYYRARQESEEIVHEHFKIIDEVKDCRLLFDKLNDTLTASWELMFAKAEEYFRQNGNLDVPARHVTGDGYALGGGIAMQRGIFQGQTQKSALTTERIRRLDAIGMLWESRTELSWQRNYAAAREYFDTHGDLRVVREYVSPNGVGLGEWIQSLREWKKAGIHQKYLTKERGEQLDAIGMIWDVSDHLFESTYQVAREYFITHGNLDVPGTYVAKDGTRLGAWICRLRAVREGTRQGAALTKEQIEKLNAIGMLWTKKHDRRWEQNLQAAAGYHRLHGDLLIPKTYKTEEGNSLGAWLIRQRQEYRAGHLEPEKIKRLEALDMDWAPRPGRGKR